MGNNVDDFYLRLDPIFREAARLIVENQKGSTSLIQRKLKLGYNRAGQIIDQLEAAMIISEFNNTEPRKVLFPNSEILEHYLNNILPHLNIDIPIFENDNSADDNDGKASTSEYSITQEEIDALINGKLPSDIREENKIRLLEFYNDNKYENVIQLFDGEFKYTNDIDLINKYLFSLFQINGCEEKAYDMGKEFCSQFKNKSYKLSGVMGSICKYLKYYEEAKEYFTIALEHEYDYIEELNEVSDRINEKQHQRTEENELEIDKKRLIDEYKNGNYESAITIFEYTKLAKTEDVEIINYYLWSLFKNNETLDKAYEVGTDYINKLENPAKLFLIMGHICKFLKKYKKAEYYFEKALDNGSDCEKYLTQVQKIIEKKEERIREREDYENAFEDQENEHEEQDVQNNSIGSHEFTNDWKRGGDILLKEHIKINDNEVTWYKKKNILWGSNTITIPISESTQVELNTSLIGTDIIIRSKGSGSINATNFKKSDAIKIQKLIIEAKNNK